MLKAMSLGTLRNTKAFVAFLPSLQWTMICQALSSVISGPLV